ncbi:hypothetical protein FM106_18240 [Brachybacterium faecium]|nr:hypothetical protein FM106_18240 [Brachybacterium faecium]
MLKDFNCRILFLVTNHKIAESFQLLQVKIVLVNFLKMISY